MVINFEAVTAANTTFTLTSVSTSIPMLDTTSIIVKDIISSTDMLIISLPHTLASVSHTRQGCEQLLATHIGVLFMIGLYY